MPRKITAKVTKENNQNPKKEKNGGFFYQLKIILGVAFVFATLFAMWTPGVTTHVNSWDGINLEPVPTKQELKNDNNSSPLKPSVGIVAGHWGNDPGAVCSDGLKEAEVNLNIATLVQKYLAEEGFEVDLLREFDENLSGYQATALVSIHADSCDFINDLATGFKVAQAMANNRPEKSARLTACIRNRYSEATGLSLHSTSVTEDMTSYHAFSEIDENTPAVIIETGFLNLDRELLTQTPELSAQGIAAGIICFIRNESITSTQEPFSQ